MRKSEQGFFTQLLIVVFFIVMIGLFITGLFIRWQPSNDVVSGIVYNTSKDNFPVGSTTFSVRAAVDTYVTEENQSSFCLPKGSPYIAIVDKAAQDKNVKVVVTKNKYFAVQAPWVCAPNVTVVETK